MLPNQSRVVYNDSVSSIDPLADSSEIGRMTSPTKITQRTTFQPASTRQFVKFNNLTLSTPTCPPSRKGQSSPVKSNTQAESPWRIRVTVEAEREDGEEGNQRITKTTTTRIPLKSMGNDDGVAQKGRGRPRKSGGDPPAARKRSGTLTPKKGRRKLAGVAGSNDRGVNKGNDDSSQKKRVGRPRKSLNSTEGLPLGFEAIHSNMVDDSASNDRARRPAARTQRNNSVPFQIPVDLEDQDGMGIHTHSESQGDGHSEKRSILTVSAVNRIPTGLPQRDHGDALMKSTKACSAEEDEARFTPVKKTPTKSLDEDKDKFKRYLNAGHTPLKYPALPTPSSSLLEDDDTEVERSAIQGNAFEERVVDRQHHVEPEPHSPHREFDTIMESEGFSMVSLDSVLSAKQHLSSPLTVQEPSAGQKDAGFQRSQPTPQVVQVASAHLELPPSPPAHTYLDISSLREETPSIMESTPRLPPLKPSQPTRGKNSTPKLARVVRAGIALQGVLDTRKNINALGSPFSSPERTRAGPVAQQSPKERLDNLFRGFGPETQRELRAGLRFGEELAKRQREAEEQKRAQHQSFEQDGDRNEYGQYPSLPSPEEHQQLPSPEQTEHEYDQMSWKYDTPATKRMKEREAEWQREREAISRQIQEANTSQVIIINSHDPTPSHLYRENEPDYADITLEQQLQEDASQYEDIWQQEAFSSDSQEEEKADDVQELPKPRRTKIPSPWRRGEDVPMSDDVTEDFSVMFYQGAGPSIVAGRPRAERKEALSQPLDFSALLNPKDGKDEPSELFDKADETAERPSRFQLQDNVSPDPVDNDSSRQFNETSSDLEDEASPESPEVEPRSPSLMRKHVSKAARQDVQGRLELPAVKKFSKGEVEQPEATQKTRECVEEQGQLPKKRPASQKVIDSSKTQAVEEAPSDATKQSSWLGLLASYLPPWPSSKPADVIATSTSETKSATNVDYPKANFISLPPHGLPHPTTPLPTCGPWTNSHYKYLLLLHKHSLLHPEDFSLPGTADKSLLGEHMEAAGHTRPISELQLAIVEMWKSTISKGNEEMGWSGEPEWDDRFILKGLFCVEVGQVNRREARRIKLLEEQENERKKLREVR